MSVNPVGGWEATEEQVRPDEVQEARRKRSSPDPLEGKISATELRGNICRIYNLISKFGFKDDVVFTPDQCEEEADGILALVNRWPNARIVLRLIGPLAAVAAAFEKIQFLVDRRNERKQAGPTTESVPAAAGGN